MPSCNVYLKDRLNNKNPLESNGLDTDSEDLFINMNYDGPLLSEGHENSNPILMQNAESI